MKTLPRQHQHGWPASGVGPFPTVARCARQHDWSERRGMMSPPRRRCVATWTLVVVLVGSSLTGCASFRGLPFRKHNPLDVAPCTLGKQPTAQDVIAHVNRNVDKIQAWRAGSLKITANNMPLGGNLVVERDRRLRLEVTSPLGKEVDFGSNDDIFWVWVRRNEQPGIYYASHTDLDHATHQFPIPFEPAWLMEALSVAPMDATGVVLDQPPGSAELRLASQHTLPSGAAVRKVVTVEACHGRVLEHSTFDAQGRPLIRVRLGDHRADPTSGAILPRYVKLDWPQQQMTLTLTMGTVEVNPSSLPDAVWEVPRIAGTPMVNLGRGGHGRPATMAADTTRTDTAPPRGDPGTIRVSGATAGAQPTEPGRPRPPGGPVASRSTPSGPTTSPRGAGVAVPGSSADVPVRPQRSRAGLVTPEMIAESQNPPGRKASEPQFELPEIRPGATAAPLSGSRATGDAPEADDSPFAMEPATGPFFEDDPADFTPPVDQTPGRARL